LPSRLGCNTMTKKKTYRKQSTKHTNKTEDRVTRRCSGRVGRSCFTSDNHRVNLVTNPVISHERGKDREDFIDRGLLLTRKLLNQGFLLFKLKSSLRRFYGCHRDLVDRYEISVSQMTTDIFSTCRKDFPVLSSFMTYHRVCN
jgi:hypothetical protein